MDLHYEIQGSGKPIVLFHSPGVDSREWKFIVPQLASTFRTVTFDGRGIGLSPPPVKPTNLVEELRNLLDHLGIERTMLVGHSMGGQATTDFALTYPERVEKLVLIAPALSGYAYSPEYLSWINEINSYAPDIEKMTRLSLSAANYSVAMASSQRDFLYEMTKQYMTRVFTEWKNFELVWPQPPAAQRLNELQTDTLYIYGDQEWEDMNGVTELFRQVPSVRTVLIKGSDHMVTLTHPDEIARLILQFTAGSGGSE